MSDFPAPFNFEIDVSGARIVVTREPLHPACLTDGEIDHHIGYLKSELDSLATKMKKAILKQRNEPLFDENDA